MAGVNLWKHEGGSKRRIALIRWKRWEMVHAVILLIVMAAFTIWVGIWIATHRFD
jgi:hypothetical protein